MFIEGHIDREFLRILKEANFDIVWECKSKADAVRHGYDRDSWDKKEKDTIARIYFDVDMEDADTTNLFSLLEQELNGPVFSEAARVRRLGIRKKLLPLMAVCGNERLRNLAVKELK